LILLNDRILSISIAKPSPRKAKMGGGVKWHIVVKITGKSLTPSRKDILLGYSKIGLISY